jgi:histone H3/H4
MSDSSKPRTVATVKHNRRRRSKADNWNTILKHVRDAGLKRICRRANIVRIRKTVLPAMRAISGAFVNAIIEKAIAYRGRRITIYCNDVKQALVSCGIRDLSASPPKK